MSYIDGFVIAVPTANKQKFIEHARQLDPIFIELGAIRVVECWGDDVPVDGAFDIPRPRFTVRLHAECLVPRPPAPPDLDTPGPLALVDRSHLSRSPNLLKSCHAGVTLKTETPGNGRNHERTL